MPLFETDWVHVPLWRILYSLRPVGSERHSPRAEALVEPWPRFMTIMAMIPKIPNDAPRSAPVRVRCFAEPITPPSAVVVTNWTVNHVPKSLEKNRYSTPIYRHSFAPA